jgi:hypothetical protein
MRLRSICVLFVIACGGGSGGGGDSPVTELSSAEQVELCETFLDDLCAHPEFMGFCDDPCITSGCNQAATRDAVTVECDIGEDGTPITEADVIDCGVSGEASVCLMGGGCMIDALESVCSGR